MNELSKKIKTGCLLTSGDLNNFNTMTIGWGLIGTVWGKEVFMCFVRPSRYTYAFMERNELFTLSFYRDDYKVALSYLGTHSGKHTNKVHEVDFNPFAVDNTVSFKEAYETIVCKKIYHQDMDAELFPSAIRNTFYASGDIHRLYIGEIVAHYQKDEN